MYRFLTFFFLISATLYAEPPQVLVSLTPYRYLVQRIAEDTVSTAILVPPGSNHDTYSPSINDIVKIGKSSLWFRVGEATESRTVEALVYHNPKIEIVDLRKDLELLVDPNHHCCCGEENDPHIWLSPKMLIPQVEIITNALIKLSPERQDDYLNNAKELILEIQNLDKEISSLLQKSKNKTVLVAHPAFGYLARDYGFSQLAIEHEGKEPTPKQLTELIKTAKELGIQRVFTQPQHNTKGAVQIAKAIDAEMIDIDPIEEDLINSIRKIARNFAQ